MGGEIDDVGRRLRRGSDRTRAVWELPSTASASQIARRAPDCLPDQSTAMVLTPWPTPGPRSRRHPPRASGVPASVRRAASPVASVPAPSSVSAADRRRRRARAARRAPSTASPGASRATNSVGVALVDRDRALVAVARRDRDEAAGRERVADVELLVARVDAMRCRAAPTSARGGRRRSRLAFISEWVIPVPALIRWARPG